MGKLIKAKSRILVDRRTRESLEKIRIYFISLFTLIRPLCPFVYINLFPYLLPFVHTFLRYDMKVKS